MQKLAKNLQNIPLKRIKIIKSFPMAPWMEQIKAFTKENNPENARLIQADWVIHIAISSSARNGMVGLGWARRALSSFVPKDRFATLLTMLGPRNEQNLYMAKLAIIAAALFALSSRTKQYIIVAIMSNKAIVLILYWPWQQSKQVNVIQVYKALKRLKQYGNIIKMM
jgi:hypothetical protein